MRVYSRNARLISLSSLPRILEISLRKELWKEGFLWRRWRGTTLALRFMSLAPLPTIQNWKRPSSDSVSRDGMMELKKFSFELPDQVPFILIYLSLLSNLFSLSSVSRPLHKPSPEFDRISLLQRQAHSNQIPSRLLQRTKNIKFGLNIFPRLLFCDVVYLRIIIYTQIMKEQVGQYWSNPPPIDSAGFTKSFDIASFDPEEVKIFYKEFGLVVFDNILGGDQIQKTIDELWAEVQQGSHSKLDRKDMKTWNFENQPILQAYGFVSKQIISRPQFWKNRSNPKVYKAFKTLFQLSSGEQLKEPLLALFDRGSILRPSKLNPKWKTEPLPHFDINPWWWTKTREVEQFQWRRYSQYNMRYQRWLGEGCFVPKVRNFTKLQGVLALSSTGPETGGFEAVCGFHNHIEQWCKDNKEGTNLRECQDLLKHMYQIYQRAGSVLIFSRELPHGINSNTSESNVRYAQYLRMAPESSLMLTPSQKNQRAIQVRAMLPKQLICSSDPISSEIYMLKQSIKEAFDSD